MPEWNIAADIRNGFHIPLYPVYPPGISLVLKHTNKSGLKRIHFNSLQIIPERVRLEAVTGVHSHPTGSMERHVHTFLMEGQSFKNAPAGQCRQLHQPLNTRPPILENSARTVMLHYTSHWIKIFRILIPRV